ncbi:hypothetical protein I79_017953 [Cricetulus griseus]|uniref:Uncharacterized protein n=1 Tax=Cricetulus griseus TaxID=10029 RepID=G3I3E8_CRIGR|nr:hypothetical protein I79_017953 [Cricetulus griseus]
MPKSRRGTLGPPALPGILYLSPGEVKTLGSSLVSHCMRNSNGYFVLLYLGAHVSSSIVLRTQRRTEAQRSPSKDKRL